MFETRRCDENVFAKRLKSLLTNKATALLTLNWHFWMNLIIFTLNLPEASFSTPPHWSSGCSSFYSFKKFCFNIYCSTSLFVCVPNHLFLGLRMRDVCDVERYWPDQRWASAISSTMRCRLDKLDRMQWKRSGKNATFRRRTSALWGLDLVFSV